MKQVSESVFVETEYMGCNFGYILTSEGIVLIDTPQRPSDAIKYRDEIERLGKEVKFLINTEPHGDHIAGNYFFSAVGVAHQGTKDYMAAASLEELKERFRQLDPDFIPAMDTYSIRLPNLTFTKSMKLYLGDHEIELLHLPGHTASETAVWIPRERVIFTGDNIFYNTQTYLHEALTKEWLNSLEKLKQIDADIFIPGHGELCTKAYIDEQAAFIKEWVAAIQAAIEKGWTVEQAQERISFLDRFPMPKNREAFGPQLQKNNVARLYYLAETGQL